MRRSEPNTSVHSSNGRLGGDQDRATLVALAEHLEQQLSAGLGQRHEAECVDDQELVAGEPLLEPQQLFLVARLHELVDLRGGDDEADRETLLAGRQAETEGDVGLVPVPELPSVMTFSRRSPYAQRARSSTSALLSEGMTLKSKASRLLITGKRAALIRRSTMRRSRSINSSSVRTAEQ